MQEVSALSNTNSTIVNEEGCLIIPKKSRNLDQLERDNSLPRDIKGVTDTGISESCSGLVGNKED